MEGKNSDMSTSLDGRIISVKGKINVSIESLKLF